MQCNTFSFTIMHSTIMLYCFSAIIEPSSDREPNPVPLPQNPKGPADVGFSRMWCLVPMVLLCASAIFLGLGIQYADSVMPYNNDSKLQG